MILAGGPGKTRTSDLRFRKPKLKRPISSTSENCSMALITFRHKRDQMSNKMIQKRLAFLRKESGTVVARDA